ncbi:MAG: FkbM family methyltransferase [Pirellulales bacterium]|nr:FkbM family methyltransferase [Pirellulales bacterium]
MKQVNQALKRFLRRTGYDVSRYQPRTHAVAKKFDLVRRLGIDLVLDVGANTGQFARELREQGYQGRIISFEPIPSVFRELERNAAADSLWTTKNFALGNEDGGQTIHVSHKSWSSSLLEVTEASTSAFPDSRAVSSESIDVRRLDSVFHELDVDGARIWLKVDTQGYEMRVLEGAVNSLAQVAMLQLELAFVPMYEGQALFHDVYHWVLAHGFRLGSLECLNWDPESGELLWLDGVFHRVDR